MSVYWIVAIVLWGAIGSGGFLYWWTRDFPLEWGEAPLVVIMALAGPISWLVGWQIHRRGISAR